MLPCIADASQTYALQRQHLPSDVGESLLRNQQLSIAWKAHRQISQDQPDLCALTSVSQCLCGGVDQVCSRNALLIQDYMGRLEIDLQQQAIFFCLHKVSASMDVLEAVKSIKDDSFQDKVRRAVACVSRTVDLYG